MLGFDPAPPPHVPELCDYVYTLHILCLGFFYLPTCRADNVFVFPTAKDGAQGLIRDEVSTAKPRTQLLKFQWDSTYLLGKCLSHTRAQ